MFAAKGFNQYINLYVNQHCKNMLSTKDCIFYQGSFETMQDNSNPLQSS